MAQIGSTTKSVACPDWGSGSYTYKLTIDETSTDTPNNTHDITVTFQILAVKSYYTNQADSDATFSITTDAGASYTPNSNVRGSHSTSYNNWVTIGTWSGTLTGNSDGTLSITASVTYGWSSGGYLPNNTTISLTASGTTLPRESTITPQYAQAPMGSNITITITQKSTSFSHKLYYKFSYMSDYTLIGQHSGITTTTYPFQVPDVASQYPNSSVAICSLRCDTYTGVNYTGTIMQSNASFNAAVPSNYTPSIEYTSSEEAPGSPLRSVTGWSQNAWPYVQGYSILRVVTTANGSNGSSITTRTIILNSESATASGSGAKTSTFTKALTGTSNILSMSASDSRGRPTSAQTTISAIAYTAPEVKINVVRCSQDGTVNALGTYARISLKWTWSSIKKTTTELNTPVQIKVYAGSSTTALITYTATTTSQTTWLRMTTYPGTYATNTTQTFRAVITDILSSNEDQTVLPKAVMPISAYDAGSGVGVTFGQMATESGFNVRLDESPAEIKLFNLLHNGKVSLIYGSDNIRHGLYSSGYSSNGTTLTSSGKWLIYRDSNGNIVLNNGVTTGGTATPIYLNNGIPTSVSTPDTGAWFGGVPKIKSDGVMEIGKYIDFHNSNTSGDNDARLFVDGTILKLSGTAPYTGTILTSNNPGATIIATSTASDITCTASYFYKVALSSTLMTEGLASTLFELDSNKGAIKVKVAGKYKVSASCYFQGNSSGCIPTVYVRSSTGTISNSSSSSTGMGTELSGTSIPATTRAMPVTLLPRLVSISANTYIYLVGRPRNAAANINCSNTMTFLQIEYAGT